MDGINTISATKDPDSDRLHVVCESQHFTSFAVLVDVGGSDVSYLLIHQHNTCILVVYGVCCNPHSRYSL